MSDDLLSAELAAFRKRAEAEIALAPHAPEDDPGSAEDALRLVAAVEAAVSKVHAPVPVYLIALHGHLAEPATSVLHCGHPASALDGPRHAVSDESDWICLDNLIRTACGGCRDDEGELADFEDCATRAAIAGELLRETPTGTSDPAGRMQHQSARTSGVPRA